MFGIKFVYSDGKTCLHRIVRSACTTKKMKIVQKSNSVEAVMVFLADDIIKGTATSLQSIKENN